MIGWVCNSTKRGEQQNSYTNIKEEGGSFLGNFPVLWGYNPESCAGTKTDEKRNQNPTRVAERQSVRTGTPMCVVQSVFGCVLICQLAVWQTQDFECGVLQGSLQWIWLVGTVLSAGQEELTWSGSDGPRARSLLLLLRGFLNLCWKYLWPAKVNTDKNPQLLVTVTWSDFNKVYLEVFKCGTFRYIEYKQIVPQNCVTLHFLTLDPCNSVWSEF